ncbi:PIN-like domain-containing protein [Flavobacterium sp. Arc2]|uniref:PIN-like domain-containing protein n=1 Tax=Flavobacterium sp. Arc2 TaxID=3046685 RepID=UPI00352E4818
MKTKFKEHHIIEFVDQIYETAIIVLDTNSVLNLYRYSEENRSKYFEILRKVEERLFLTHHICDEFYKNRLIIIENRSSFKDTINELIEENQNKLLNIINNYTGADKYNSALSILKHENSLKECIVSELETSMKKITSSIQDFKQDLDFNYLQGKDPILEELVEIIKEKVSFELTAEEKENIYIDGKERYEKEIPPGYKDNAKNSIDKFGDLIIWNELQALSVKTDRPILFISDDRKEDWAIKFKGHDLGPRKELIKEFINNTNNLFYSITTKKFIQLISESYKVANTETLEAETENIQKNIQQKEVDNVKKNIDRLKKREKNYDESQGLLERMSNPLDQFNRNQDMLIRINNQNNEIQNSNEILKRMRNPLDDFNSAQEIFRQMRNSNDEIINSHEILKRMRNPLDDFNSAQEIIRQMRNPNNDDNQV